MDFCNIIDLKLFQIFYNDTRPHQALFGNAPSQRSSKDVPLIDYNNIKYEKVKHAHGLLTVFKIAA
jgi:hypothetical protein